MSGRTSERLRGREGERRGRHEGAPGDDEGPSNRGRAAIFLDKDGTLLRDVPYNVDPTLMRFMPHAQAGLRRMTRLAMPLIVVSNQPGVALGLFGVDALMSVERHLADMFARSGCRLEAFYACPHHPRGTVASFTCACLCRKPMPGLLQRAAVEHGIDLDRSWFVGDILDDVEAGRRAGCRTILLDNGHETEWKRTLVDAHLRTPDHVVPHLEAAARLIGGWADTPGRGSLPESTRGRTDPLDTGERA